MALRAVIKIDLVAAARPNFMKVAPLAHALRAQDWCTFRLIHTGQHYDPLMSDAFFRDLRLGRPDVSLGVGSGTHAEQTAGVMVAYERECLRERPDWTVVVGDVNSSLACALVASKLDIRVAHLEAGLRSRDRTMPEEINRVLTDAISDLLWTPSSDGDENLLREGVSAAKIERVGNIMIDSLEMMRSDIEARQMPRKLNLLEGNYGVVTLHRPSNVDNPEKLKTIIDALRAVASKLSLVFPVHPRTRKALQQLGHASNEFIGNVRLIDPIGYIDFMSLVFGSRLVITDSGGVQEETTYLGIPCLTLRPNTERPITVTMGTNQLTAVDKLQEVATRVLGSPKTRGKVPELWDGLTAMRVTASLRRAAVGAPRS